MAMAALTPPATATANDTSDHHGHLALISTLLGLTYFTAWSASFYPQPLANARRRSVAGTTAAFPLLNLLGFGAYTAYTGALLLAPAVRAQYAARHPRGAEPSVGPWDLAFAAHGTAGVAVALSQFWWWPGGGEEARRSRRIEGWVWAVLGLGLAFVAAVAGVVLLGPRHGRDPQGWAYIDIIYALSNVKLLVTLTKYTPQIIYNARRRSTAGWSIWQPLLDLVGSFASIAQLFVDAVRFADTGSDGWKDGVAGNMVKFWLGNMSIAFDVIFMVQHYLLYVGNESGKATGLSGRPVDEDAEVSEDPERRPLLKTTGF